MVQSRVPEMRDGCNYVRETSRSKTGRDLLAGVKKVDGATVAKINNRSCDNTLQNHFYSQLFTFQ